MDLPTSSLALYPKKASVRSLSATIVPFPVHRHGRVGHEGQKGRKHVAAMGQRGQVLRPFRRPGFLAPCSKDTRPRLRGIEGPCAHAAWAIRP